MMGKDAQVVLITLSQSVAAKMEEPICTLKVGLLDRSQLCLW